MARRCPIGNFNRPDTAYDLYDCIRDILYVYKYSIRKYISKRAMYAYDPPLCKWPTYLHVVVICASEFVYDLFSRTVFLHTVHMPRAKDITW